MGRWRRGGSPRVLRKWLLRLLFTRYAVVFKFTAAIAIKPSRHPNATHVKARGVAILISSPLSPSRCFPILIISIASITRYFRRRRRHRIDDNDVAAPVIAVVIVVHTSFLESTRSFIHHHRSPFVCLATY